MPAGTTDSTHSKSEDARGSRRGAGIYHGCLAPIPQSAVLHCQPSAPCARGLLPGAAQAQSKLEARYTVTLAGIPLGTGTWVIDIAADQYTAVASGRTTGLVKLISDGSGSGGSRGALQGAKSLRPATSSSTISDKKADEVRMTLRAGAVKDVVGRAAARARRPIACRSPRRTARA